MGISVRAQASNSGSSTNATVTVPAGAQVGDTILLAFSQGNTDVQTSSPSTATAGPTTQNSTGTFVTKTYLIPVDGTTVAAGSSLACAMSATRQWGMNLLVLTGGVSAASLVQFHNESNANVSNVVMPSLTTTATDFLVELACSKSNGTTITDFTAPSGWTKQSVQSTANTFGPATAFGVYNGNPAAAGTYGGETWTPNQTGGAALGFVLALKSGPTAAFTSSQSGLTLSVDGSSSTAPSPATIASYDWDWGDGSTHGTGATATHSYATAGTYTVKLTVTDSTSTTGTTSTSVTVLSPAGTVTVQSIAVGTGWTPSSGTQLSAVTDGDPTTFITSSSPPTGQEFDFVLQALTTPSAGQPLKVFLAMDSLLASSATLNAQLFEGATQRSSLTGVPIPAGSGSSVSGTVTLTFPWTDVQNITTGGWNSLKVKLQVTAN